MGFTEVDGLRGGSSMLGEEWKDLLLEDDFSIDVDLLSCRVQSLATFAAIGVFLFIQEIFLINKKKYSLCGCRLEF